ncbi:MAG: hypothetical protein M0R48_05085 [Candidatus Omnitrophica bacterium]|jgi:hypothetical protein|nr:hypothetical protein [Candidatus Omnitrophota bacterium]
MKNFIIFLSIIVNIFIFLPVFSQETITITTYYPAPFGIYEELRSKRVAIGDNYVNSNYCWGTGCTNQVSPEVDLAVEGSTTIGTFQRRNTLSYPSLYVNGFIMTGTDSASNAIPGFIHGTASSDPTNFDEELVIGIGGYDRNNDGAINKLDNGDNRSKIWIGPEPDDGGLGQIVLDAKTVYVQHANLGVGTDDPKAKLDVNGEVKIKSSGLSCNGDTKGAMRYYNNEIQFCHNNRWQAVGHSIACDFEGVWIYWDDKADGNDFGVVCKSGKVERWCNYPAGAQKGLHPNVYDCNCSGCL